MTDTAERLLPERNRFCVGCGGTVGRGRDGRPGRLRGTCRWCRAPFDLTPHLRDGAVLHGRRGGAWRVTGPLARGGRSWLHSAVDDATGRPGVLSRVRGPGGPEAGRVATEEPDALLALDHPGLVRVLDVVDADGRAGHLVLEPVAGVPAGTRAPLPAPEAAGAVAAVLPALAHLHDRGLLHADLTPHHLMTGGPAGTVLVDLGSVRRADDRTTAVWATDGYVAPEIVPGGAGPSAASDVFALGRVLAALVAQRSVRGTGDDTAGDGLADVVRSATAVDPAARPGLPALAGALADVVATAGHPPGRPRHGRDDD